MYRILIGFLFCLLVCINGYSQSVKGNFYVTGKVKVDQGVVDSTHLKLFRNNILIQDMVINRTGTFRVLIELSQAYQFQFINNKYYPKTIDFDTRIPPGVCANDCSFPPYELALMLYRKVTGVSEMAQPNGKISYNSQLDVFDAEILRQKSDLGKMIDKALAEAKQMASLYDQQKIRDKKTTYDRLINEGDSFFKTGNYELSMQPFHDAAMILPNQTYPRDKVDQAFQLLVSAQLHKNFGIPSEENFLKYLNYGDLKFSEREYTVAMMSYKMALSIRPNEQLVKSKLISSEVEVKKMRDLAWAEIDHKKKVYASHEIKYRELIASGDDLIAKENIVGAKDFYSQAATQIDENSYALLMLQKIGDIVSNEELAIKLSKAKEEADKKMLADARNKAYRDAIAEADQLLLKRLYRDAIENYELALTIKEYELYPKKQIENINDILAKLQLNGEEYNRLIRDGDQLLLLLKLQPAKDNFLKAHKLIPEEKYALQKIAEIDNLIKKQDEENANQEKYKKILTQADSLFNQEQYAESINPYQKASDLKPTEKYPKDQILKIRGILSRESADQKLLFQKQTEYDQIIAQADEFFKHQSYQAARSLYLKALQIFPGQEYPISQIKRIDELLNATTQIAPTSKSRFDEIDFSDLQNISEEDRKAAFKEAMDMGESFMKSKEWGIARFYFRRALSIYSTDNRAIQQMNEADRMIRGFDVNESKYNEFIKKADESFKTGDISIAKFYYTKALELKPTDNYAKERFDVADQLLRSALTSAGDREFDNAIIKGDEAFATKNYPLARFFYKKALSLKPGNSKAINKIDQSEKALEQDKTTAGNSEYDSNIQMGNQAFQLKNYGSARNYYRKALSLKPTDAYVLNQLAAIDALLKK